jgi:hypothetical protein
MRYPIIYNTNIFSIIKKIEDYRKKTISNLKNILNEIRFYNYMQKKDGEKIDAKFKDKINMLFVLKRKLINEILLLKSAFSIIDQMFQQEMDNAEYKRKNWLFIKTRYVCNLIFCRNYNRKATLSYKLPNRMNPFISRLLDPFQRELDEDLDFEIDRIGKLDLHVTFDNKDKNEKRRGRTNDYDSNEREDGFFSKYIPWNRNEMKINEDYREHL